MENPEQLVSDEDFDQWIQSLREGYNVAGLKWSCPIRLYLTDKDIPANSVISGELVGRFTIYSSTGEQPYPEDYFFRVDETYWKLPTLMRRFPKIVDDYVRDLDDGAFQREGWGCITVTKLQELWNEYKQRA